VSGRRVAVPPTPSSDGATTPSHLRRRRRRKGTETQAARQTRLPALPGLRQSERGRQLQEGRRMRALQDGVQGGRAGQHAGQTADGRGRQTGQAPKGAQTEDHQLGQEEIRHRHSAAAVLDVARHHGPGLPGTLEAHVRVQASVQAA